MVVALLMMVTVDGGVDGGDSIDVGVGGWGVGGNADYTQ